MEEKAVTSTAPAGTPARAQSRPAARANANDEIDLSQIRRVRIYNTANNGAVVMKIDNLMLLEKQP